MQDIETARILDNDKYDVDTFDLKLNVGTEEVPSRYTYSHTAEPEYCQKLICYPAVSTDIVNN